MSKMPTFNLRCKVWHSRHYADFDAPPLGSTPDVDDLPCGLLPGFPREGGAFPANLSLQMQPFQLLMVDRAAQVWAPWDFGDGRNDNSVDWIDVADTLGNYRGKYFICMGTYVVHAGYKTEFLVALARPMFHVWPRPIPPYFVG